MKPTVYQHAPWRTVLILVLCCLGTAHAGTLSLGQPAIQGDQYAFPVALAGADAQVSALDFRVQFDPRVFLPVSAAAGPAALAANKMVSANNPAPGQYVVVMMGLNQATVPGGIVANLVFQRTGDGEGALATTVGITDLTLAGPDGSELAASGSSVSVPLREAKPGETAEGEDPANPDPDADPDPANPDETPADPATPAGERPRDPGTTPARRMLAGAPADNATPPPSADPAALAPARAASAASSNPVAVGSNSNTAVDEGSGGGDVAGVSMPERAGTPGSAGRVVSSLAAKTPAPTSEPGAVKVSGAPGTEAPRPTPEVATPGPGDAALPAPNAQGVLGLPAIGLLALLGVVVLLLLRVWRRSR